MSTPAELLAIYSAQNMIESFAKNNGFSNHLIDYNKHMLNVKDFGAKGDLTHDDTAAIQAAINKACEVQGRGREVKLPAGIYKVTGTLYIPASSQGISLIGEGQTRTMIYRNTNYGDTLVLGDSASAAIESTVIEGIFFYHDFGGYENLQPASTLVNKPTTGAHLNCWNPIRASIRKCSFWNMRSNIIFNGGAKSEIAFCSVRGAWDHTATQAQVTTENILLQRGSAASSYALPTAILIKDIDSTGYLSPARSVTYGTVTTTISENVGSLSGIRIKAAEVIQIFGGSIGGHNDSGISIEPQNGITCISISIIGTFIDGNRFSGIRCSNGGGTQTCYNLNISDVILIGQENSDNAIWIGNAASDTTPSASNVTISNINISNYVKSAIILLSAKMVNIDGGIIRDWNTHAGFLADGFNGTGIYVGDGVKHLRIKSVSIGGGFNGEDYSGTALNACAFGIVISSGVTDHHIINNSIPPTLVNVPILDSSAVAGTSRKRIINNIGYNENRTPSSPTLPASTVAYKNPFGSPAWVKITGGVVNDIVLNGISIIITGGTNQFYIGPGDSVTLTYSSTPTWTWFPQ